MYGNQNIEVLEDSNDLQEEVDNVNAEEEGFAEEEEEEDDMQYNNNAHFRNNQVKVQYRWPSQINNLELILIKSTLWFAV